MRIVGGSARGLRLAEVGEGDAAAALRPTPDRVREAVFNRLAAWPGGDRVAGARVLDLFAGTGAMGLEALSRGAARVALVDDGAAARALIRTNIERMRAMGQADVWRRDATAMGANRGAPYTLVFLDPPYGRGLGATALASALAGGWVAPGALVVWEEAAPQAPPAGFALHDARRYGRSWITVLEAALA